MPDHWSEDDHDLMDRFLSRIYDDVTSGVVGRTAFVDNLAYVMTALYMGERCHALDIFRRVNMGELRLVKGSRSDP